MTSFFLSILNISVTATFVAVAVILLRFLFKKAPRWTTCLLWALVGLRLAFPFSVESELSLVPSTDLLPFTSASENAEALKARSGSYAVNNAVNPQLTPLPEAEKVLELADILAIVWISVAALVLIYGIISYICMYLRVRTAIPLKKNIYQSENVKSPFVLGFIKPKVYIPFNLTGKTLKYVLAHEEAHIKRKDHIVKPLAYVLLSFHWFNPIMWLSYVLLCRDIEVACDEKVIKDFSINKRKNYAFALLNCKVNRSNIAVCPVAFGEVDVSTRIKKTLAYKKPAMWVIMVAIGISVIASGCLLTNPKAEEFYTVETIIEYDPDSDVITQPITEVTQTNSESTAPPATTEAVTAVPETEMQTEVPTEVYEEYYEEAYYYEESEPEPVTIISFYEYMNQKFEEERAKAEEERLQRLLKSTSNHSDECMCSDCDDLRDAGYYPMIIDIPEELYSDKEYDIDVVFTTSVDYINTLQ